MFKDIDPCIGTYAYIYVYEIGAIDDNYLHFPVYWIMPNHSCLTTEYVSMYSLYKLDSIWGV